MEIKIDFSGKNEIHDVLRALYSKLNSYLDTEFIKIYSDDTLVWEAYYDDLFGLLSYDNFTKKYGNDIKLVLLNLEGFQKHEPENCKKFIEWVLDYQVRELPKHGINFSYQIK